MAGIKNIDKAAERIKKAVKDKENIILYGDSDLDGMASVVILKESIRNLGGRAAAFYFPDREEEGYGINEKALEHLKKYAPGLLVVADCGIANFKEVDLAKKLKFQVVIIDHHEPLKKLPKASIIVNPKQKGDKYPFKEFSAAGVVFRVAESVLGKKMSSSLRNDFLELVALATIADMMPKKEDNLEFIEQGLSSLVNTVRPGLKAFWEINGSDPRPMDVRRISQKIISACHAGESVNHVNEGYLLLTCASLEEAKAMAENLLEKSKLRHERIIGVKEEVESKLQGKEDSPIIFEGSESWKILTLGPVASLMQKNSKKPIFLYSKKGGESQGAVRTPEGLDGVKMMSKCSKLLETYGGHPKAGGFRIKNKNLGKFEKCLEKQFK